MAEFPSDAKFCSVCGAESDDIREVDMKYMSLGALKELFYPDRPIAKLDYDTVFPPVAVCPVCRRKYDARVGIMRLSKIMRWFFVVPLASFGLAWWESKFQARDFGMLTFASLACHLFFVYLTNKARASVDEFIAREKENRKKREAEQKNQPTRPDEDKHG